MAFLSPNISVANERHSLILQIFVSPVIYMPGSMHTAKYFGGEDALSSVKL